MDATESAALSRLGERDQWPAHELPAEIDADVLRCLDMAELVEAASVILVNQQKHPGDSTPPAVSQGRWFSPMKSPEMAGGWDRIRHAPSLGAVQPERSRVDVKEVLADDFGGFFPKRSHRIVSVWIPKPTPSFYVRLTERGRAELARLRRRGTQPVAPPADTDETRRAARLATGATAQRMATEPATKGTDWRDVQRRLLELYGRGERYTSIGQFARQLRSSKPTVKRAIDDSPKLKGWQARHLESKRSPRATSINDVVTDRAQQTREADPAKEAQADDVDIVFNRLIQEAQPQERAKLHGMSDDERKQLVALVCEDTDRFDRLMGRKP